MQLDSNKGEWAIEGPCTRSSHIFQIWPPFRSPFKGHLFGYYVCNALSLGYGSIPIDTFLVGWTSIYQLFWCSHSVPGFWPIATSSGVYHKECFFYVKGLVSMHIPSTSEEGLPARRRSSRHILRQRSLRGSGTISSIRCKLLWMVAKSCTSWKRW